MKAGAFEPSKYTWWRGSPLQKGGEGAGGRGGGGALFLGKIIFFENFIFTLKVDSAIFLGGQKVSIHDHPTSCTKSTGIGRVVMVVVFFSLKREFELSSSLFLWPP